MRGMGWYRKIVVVVRKHEHFAQIKLGVGANIARLTRPLIDTDRDAVNEIQ